MRIKSIELENVCGYKKANFDFMNEDKVNEISLLYGVNGCGKSTLLDVANIISAPRRYQGRDFSMYFRKMVHHENYDPTYQDLEDFKNVMKIRSVFTDGDKDYKVDVEVDPKKVKRLQAGDPTVGNVGVVLNELPIQPHSYAFYSNADNPANMNRFQIDSKAAEQFLDIAKKVYGYECYLEKDVEEFDSQKNDYVNFFTDFVIIKDDDGSDVRVHFKRMSAGEKKIATLISEICSTTNQELFDIYLIDNVEMHIYMQRHTDLIDKLYEHFPDKQIIATTHSPILVGVPDLIDPYVKSESLYDVISLKKEGAAQLM